MAVTRRAALIALALTIAVLLASSPVAVLIIADGLLLLAVLLDVLLATSPRQLAMTRSLPPGGRLGEPLDATLVISNGGSRDVRALIRDAWPPSAGLHPPSAKVAIPGGERRRIAQQFVPSRRGDRLPVTVTIRSYGPLRLGARQRNVRVPGRVRVQPAFPSRKLLPEKLSRLRIIEGMVATRGPGRGSEFDSLREYVRG